MAELKVQHPKARYRLRLSEKEAVALKRALNIGVKYTTVDVKAKLLADQEIMRDLIALLDAQGVYVSG